MDKEHLKYEMNCLKKAQKEAETKRRQSILFSTEFEYQTGVIKGLNLGIKALKTLFAGEKNEL